MDGRHPNGWSVDARLLSKEFKEQQRVFDTRETDKEMDEVIKEMVGGAGLMTPFDEPLPHVMHPR